jgi:hypothetical protein
MMLFAEKMSVLQHMSSTVFQEIFSGSVRPAYKLEVALSDSSVK